MPIPDITIGQVPPPIVAGGLDWRTLLPYIISGGTTLASGVMGSRAAGKATELGVEGANYAAELQAMTAEERLELLRQIYNRDIALEYPRYRTGVEALKQLTRGAGIDVPESTFDVPDKPVELGPFRRPGQTGFPGVGGGPGDLSSSLLSADATLKPGRGVASTMGKGALAGGSLGFQFGGPLGAAVGAAGGAEIGLLTSAFGRGRREANQIVPYQNALTERIGRIEEALSAKQSSGAATDQDWQDAINQVSTLKNQFYGLTNDFGRAGPGARQTIGSWVDPMLALWGQRQLRPPGRRYGGPVYARRGGGFTMPSQTYLVGEEAPEFYDPNPPGPPYDIVGENGPQIFIPPEDGNIIPMDRMTDGEYSRGGFQMPGLVPRARGGPVRGQSKIHKVMSEFKSGNLRSSSGRKVTSRAQAIAIAISEAGMSKPIPRQEGGPVEGLAPGYVYGTAPPGVPKSYFGGKEVYQLPTNKIMPGFTGTASSQIPQGYVSYGGTLVATDSPEFAKAQYAGPSGNYSALGVPGAKVSIPGGGTAILPPGKGLKDYSGTAPARIQGWGWVQDAKTGQWTHPETKATGRWTPEGQFINETAGKSWNPATEALTDVAQPVAQPGGFRFDPIAAALRGATGIGRVSATLPGGGAPAPGGFRLPGASQTNKFNKLDLDGGDGGDGGAEPPPKTQEELDAEFFALQTPEEQARIKKESEDAWYKAHPEQERPPEIPVNQRYAPPAGGAERIQGYGWVKDAQGNWTHPGTGATGHWTKDGKFINDKENKIFDPATGKMTSGPLDLGELTEPFSEPPFSYGPGTPGYRPFPGGFTFDPKTQGYQPFNERFAFDPAAAGYKPFNEQFAYDPTEGGFQRPNEKFEFDEADLLKDPGYRFRLSEGEKAIERSAAARGMLSSGRTFKDLTRFSQGTAAQEYANAYGRARGEFELDRAAEQENYTRMRSEFGLSEAQTDKAYTRATQEFERNTGQTKDAYIRAKGEQGLDYQQAQDAYNRAFDEYFKRWALFESQQGKRRDLLETIAGVGGGQ